MIVKRLLREWHREIKKDLAGVPYKQISTATGINLQTIRNYLTLTEQETFDPEVIKKINAYRDEYLELAKSLTKTAR